MKTMLRAITKKYYKLLISVTLIASLGFSLAWGLSSGYASLEKSLNSYVADYDYPDGYITTKVTSASNAGKLTKLGGVQDCDARLCADTVMKTAGGDLFSVRVFSYSDKEKQAFYTWEEKKGAEDGVLLEYNFAVSNGISAGDTVAFRVRGEYRSYVVAGIVSRPETLAAKISDSAWGINYDFGYVYAPAALLRKEYEKDSAESREELDEKSDQLSAEKESALKLIDEKKKELADAKKLLAEKSEEYSRSKEEADAAIAELYAKRKELIKSAKELNDKIKDVEEACRQAEKTRAVLEEKYDKLSAAKAALDEIDAAKQKLDDAQNALGSESIQGLIGLLRELPADTGMSTLLSNARSLSELLQKAGENGLVFSGGQTASQLESALRSFEAQAREDLNYLNSQEVKELIEQADDSSVQDERYSALIAILRRYSRVRVTDAATLREAYADAEANLKVIIEQSQRPQIQQAIDMLKGVDTDKTVEELLAEISAAESTLSLLAGDKPIEQMTVGEVTEQYDKALTDIEAGRKELDEARAEIIAGLSANGVDEDSLSKVLKELSDGISAAEKALTDLKKARVKLVKLLNEVNDGINKIDKGIAGIKGELSDAQSQLSSAEKEISQGEKKLSQAAKELKTFSDLESELESAYEQLEEGEGYDRLCNQFLLYIDEDADADKVIQSAVKALGEDNVKSSYSYEDSPVKARLDKNLEPMSTLMSLLPAIFYIVVLIVVFLFMSMMIRQSRRDIGIMMALGIGKTSIRLLFCAAGAGVALGGIAVGSGLGLLLRGYIGGYFESFFPLPDFTYLVDAGGFLTGAAACVGVCVSASLLGTVMISRVTPKEAMSRPVQANIRIPALIDRLTRKAAPMRKYSVTSLLRNKGRFVFSAVCTAASVMLIFTSVSFIASKNHVITQTFDERIRYDCQIFFETEPSQTLINDIEKLEGVSGTESILMYEPDISAGKAAESCTVYAVSPDNSMIGISDGAGRPLAVKPGEIILERHTADALGVAQGDRVTVGGLRMTVGGITDQCVNRAQYITLGDAAALGEPELYSALCRFDSQPRRELLSLLTENDGYLYSVFTDTLYEYNSRLYSTYDLAAWILIFFAVLTGFVIVFNTAVTNLQDNKRELCVLRTLGFTHSEISISRFSQSLLQFIAASVIGIAPGTALARFTLLRISTATEEFAYASGFIQVLIVLLIVFIYITVSHFAAMRTMKKWNFTEAVKDRE